MKIIRDGEKITYSDENMSGTVSVTKIGTAADNSLEKFNAWVRHCAALVTPNAHTFPEGEQYLYTRYDVQPLALSDPEIRHFKASVLTSCFPDRLEHRTSVYKAEMTDAELVKSILDQQSQLKEAIELPADRFGLKLHGYRVSPAGGADNPPSAEKREGAGLGNLSGLVLWEETTGFFSGRGLGCAALNELISFLGVTQEDIDGLTPRFIGYIQRQADLGRLPKLTEVNG